MKLLFVGIFAVLACSTLASTNFSERKLESAMASASKSGKLPSVINSKGRAPRAVSAMLASGEIPAEASSGFLTGLSRMCMAGLLS